MEPLCPCPNSKKPLIRTSYIVSHRCNPLIAVDVNPFPASVISTVTVYSILTRGGLTTHGAPRQ
ncbi:unnamed protein product [Staurois parvus]|uniref:Uncharacterized protein n=1 Tax=Staurois parvus TaxID=386267 RepID=A0ABN9EGY1_9NEOB|nr:unnamed protein product [Staurois parvus]